MTFADFRQFAAVRVLASPLSWFMFTLGFTMLLLGAFAVLAVGGSCASGGPYEIAVECPDAAGLAPIGVFVGLGSVAVALLFGQGFGTSLIDLAWPILFCGLGAMFLYEFVVASDPVGLIIGGLFEIMGLIPLIISLRASVQRAFLGAVNVRGERFIEGPKARRSPIGMKPAYSEYPVLPRAVDWLLSLVLWVVPGGLGFVAAQGIYASL